MNDKFDNSIKDNKNGFPKNYLNINYVNNDLFHQNSHPADSEIDSRNNKQNINPNAFDIISSDIYESIIFYYNKNF